MFELPLFPLNTVLFPGMPIRLHIFEERYKLMINRCHQNSTPFGVTLIKSGQEVGEAAQPFLIGCMAQITQLERLQEGRMNIVAVGTERFLIHDFKYDEPYLVGAVEALPLTQAETASLTQVARSLRAWIRRYLDILAKASDAKLDLQHLPSDPVRLAYLASFLIQVPAWQKQNLLSIGEASQLLTDLRILYRREVTLLQAMLLWHGEEAVGPFSPN
jgi:Lon protease-like protein